MSLSFTKSSMTSHTLRIQFKLFTMASLLFSLLCPYLPLSSPLIPRQPHRHICCYSVASSLFLPQGLCICCAFFLGFLDFSPQHDSHLCRWSLSLNITSLGKPSLTTLCTIANSPLSSIFFSLFNFSFMTTWQYCLRLYF